MLCSSDHEEEISRNEGQYFALKIYRGQCYLHASRFVVHLLSSFIWMLFGRVHMLYICVLNLSDNHFCLVADKASLSIVSAFKTVENLDTQNFLFRSCLSRSLDGEHHSHTVVEDI